MLRMALIAMLVAGVPVLGTTDVSAAAAKSKTEKSAKRKGEKKSTRKNKDRSTNSSTAKSGRDDTHTKKKKGKPTTVATTVRKFNRTVVKIARRGTDWVSPYVKSRHVKPSNEKRKYRAPARSRHHRRSCTAAARKRFGTGRRLRGITAHRYGARACREALKKCRSKLRRHKSTGRNPYARCVIAYRG